MAIFRLKRAFMGEIGEKCKCGMFWNVRRNRFKIERNLRKTDASRLVKNCKYVQVERIENQLWF